MPISSFTLSSQNYKCAILYSFYFIVLLIIVNPTLNVWMGFYWWNADYWIDPNNFRPSSILGFKLQPMPAPRNGSYHQAIFITLTKTFFCEKCFSDPAYIFGLTLYLQNHWKQSSCSSFIIHKGVINLKINYNLLRHPNLWIL